MTIRNYIATIARNGLQFTQAAVASFLTQDIPTEVLLLDNASTDGTSGYYRENPDPRVHLLRIDNQESVAAAWNRLCRIAFGDGQEYLLIAGNDTILPTWFYRLLLADGGQLVTGVGCMDLACLQSEPRPTDKRPHPDFSAFVIRREIFEAVGGFDENCIGAYCEDVVFHLEAHKRGFEAYSIGCGHYHLMNGAIRANPEQEREIHEQANRNRRYVHEKYGFPVASPEYYEFFKKPYRGQT